MAAIVVAALCADSPRVASRAATFRGEAMISRAHAPLTVEPVSSPRMTNLGGAGVGGPP